MHSSPRLTLNFANELYNEVISLLPYMIVTYSTLVVDKKQSSTIKKSN